jgi:hypothetical protein
MDYGANDNPDYYILKPTVAPRGEVRYADGSLMRQELVLNRRGWAYRSLKRA